MKSYITNSVIILSFFSNLAFAKAENPIKRKSINYTVILDLSDRVLNSNQMSYDIAQIELLFQKFKKKAKQNLIITSKDRFVVKIIPQKGSTLDHNYFENLLQLRLDQISIRDKNKRLENLDSLLSPTLEKLKKAAFLGNRSSDYAGVDLWSFLYENRKNLTKKGYENSIVIMTDGYLDFEDNGHVLKKENKFTGTGFINNLNSNNWEQIAQNTDLGILSIPLDSHATWIVTGIKSKKPQDLYQVSKIKYFWSKWIKESANTQPVFINYSTKTQILTELNSTIN